MVGADGSNERELTPLTNSQVYDMAVDLTPPEAPRLDLPLITLPERNSRPALRESLRGLRIAAAHDQRRSAPRRGVAAGFLAGYD